MIERRQLTVIVGPHPQGLPRCRPVSHGTKHLIAAEHQLDRLSHHPRRHDAEHLRSGDHSFAAETAAEERAADMDFVRGDSEQSGQATLRHGETLAWRVD